MHKYTKCKHKQSESGSVRMTSTEIGWIVYGYDKMVLEVKII